MLFDLSTNYDLDLETKNEIEILPGDFYYATKLSRGHLSSVPCLLLDAVSVGNAETGRKFSAFFVRQRA